MLEIGGLRRRYGDVLALDGVSFTVEGGEMVGFVGRNGAGKTTTMRAVLGLVRPDEGEVRWKGVPVDAETRRRFGYMPEERGLYPRMRVVEQLAFLAELSGRDRAGAREAAEMWAERLGVAERGRDRLEQLSLGNQQRVQLAAALVHEPDLLVLDEPFSGLDPVGVDVLAGVLRAEVERGVACVFSSHQLDLVEQVCDRVTIIDEGRIVASGVVGELRAPDGERRLRVELEDRAVDWAEGLPGIVDRRREGRGVVLTLAEGTDPDTVLDAARAAGRVRHFAVYTPRLSDLFREVVANQ